MSDAENLFVALRDAFPGELDAIAIETADTPVPLYYTWRDIDRASARIANLLQWLQLPAGARVAVQVDKSVESLLLYLAVLRAGCVYLPLNNAYQSAELEYFLRDAEPRVLVCSSKNFGWASRIDRHESRPNAGSSSSRVYIVGTPMNTVASGSRCVTARGRKRLNHSMRLPLSSAPCDATKRPCTWKIGSACSSTSPGRQFQYAFSVRAFASRLACVSIAPLLRPVVPLV